MARVSMATRVASSGLGRLNQWWNGKTPEKRELLSTLVAVVLIAYVIVAFSVVQLAYESLNPSPAPICYAWAAVVIFIMLMPSFPGWKRGCLIIIEIAVVTLVGLTTYFMVRTLPITISVSLSEGFQQMGHAFRVLASGVR